MVNTAVRILRQEAEALARLEEDAGLEWAAMVERGALAVAYAIPAARRQIAAERAEIWEALECLEAGGLWTQDDRTGDLFAGA
jgi:glutaminase